MSPLRHFQDLIHQARSQPPLRVAVVNAAQRVVLETLREAAELGLVAPHLVGARRILSDLSADIGWPISAIPLTEAADDETAAAVGVRLVREGQADALMKGQVHTDVLMHAVLDAQRGLRVAGRRVSHAFVCDVPTYPRLLIVSDAAINIAPDLGAKAEILQNAVDLARLLGSETPKVAVLSAVETVNPAIASTLDAAALTLMAKRGQIAAGALVDGPLAFDNAVSLGAATEKGIASDVAGEADILLVPDLVSGNMLAKSLEYLGSAVVAGVVLGLRAPLVLTSRADPMRARLAALAIASLQHHSQGLVRSMPSVEEPAVHCAAQPEAACCPLRTPRGDAERHRGSPEDGGLPRRGLRSEEQPTG
ncbi:phosphate acetyltransferase [Methylorubrum extorquens DM4]|uniref:Phosphate acetyltransferase n=1 Tax=Methylorubrum extorquens (strain DSM 6343 / CIP 106787 / DM4) TaxID=661410 RepID=C7CFX3_METED|nr:bifunctional enoyl-CoA hydratase/phosphate acetyltransferase [Methylorubrum extorquens]CAX23049.1 phosphate acetyltransferase [Methylorubrum extorquens DM4]